MIVSDRKLTPELVTYHNTYAMGKGGYDAAVRIVTTGGKAKAVDDKVRITGRRRGADADADRAVEDAACRRSAARRGHTRRSIPTSRSGWESSSPSRRWPTARWCPIAKDADAAALMPQLVKSLVDVRGRLRPLVRAPRQGARGVVRSGLARSRRRRRPQDDQRGPAGRGAHDRAPVAGPDGEDLRRRPLHVHLLRRRAAAEPAGDLDRLVEAGLVGRLHARHQRAAGHEARLQRQPRRS